MVRTIVRDQIFLSQKLDLVTRDDNYEEIIRDLKDTLQANSATCVGMTANMIGIKKQIIIVSIGFAPIVMINPKITSRSGRYETEEGCLSLDGLRKTIRYKQITLEYMDEHFNPKKQEFSGFLAQNIQHQVNHCEGIII